MTQIFPVALTQKILWDPKQAMAATLCRFP